MSLKSLNRIKAEAAGLGFSACGASPAGAVDDVTADAFRRWIADGNHATMHYLAENIDKRLDPRLLMPGVKTIVSVALNYSSLFTLHSSLKISSYALGKDYHDVMKKKLHALAAAIGATDYRAFCDTAPVLERYWAARSGLGWIGRNHQLIIPHAGSMFFLGELFLKEKLDAYDEPIPPHCGNCTACLEACPTHALNPFHVASPSRFSRHSQYSQNSRPSRFSHPSRSSRLDCRRCLSYHTIENRGEIPPGIAAEMGSCFYGCDRCQNACPHNRFATPTTEPDLRPNSELLAMTDDGWRALTVEDYRRLFKGSAVKRAKYEGLMRNIMLALKS